MVVNLTACNVLSFVCDGLSNLVGVITTEYVFVVNSTGSVTFSLCPSARDIADLVPHCSYLPIAIQLITSLYDITCTDDNDLVLVLYATLLVVFPAYSPPTCVTLYNAVGKLKGNVIVYLNSDTLTPPP